MDRYRGVAWLPGQDAMLVTREQVTAPDSPARERLLKMRVYLHPVGNNPDTGRAIFGYGVDPQIPIGPAELASVIVTSGSRHMMAVIGHIRGPWKIHVAPIVALSDKKID